MINIPVKDIIVNDDAQVRLLRNNVAPAGAAAVWAATDKVQLEGFLSDTLVSDIKKLSGVIRVIKDVPVAGVAEVKTYTVTSTASIADAVFKLVTESLDLSTAEFQNGRVTKFYQISAAQTSAANIAAKIAAAINGDKSAPVTASAAAAVVTLTAKQKGVSINLYSTDIVGTLATTTPASLPVNTYDSLKSINWAQNVDWDRNTAWFPLPGNSYNSYYFEVNSNVAGELGHQLAANEKHNQALTGFKVYVKAGSVLDLDLTEFATDVNALP